MRENEGAFRWYELCMTGSSINRMRWPALEREILDYLIRHPDAQDTIEGIVDWWLLEQRMRTVQSEVRRALVELEQRGFVVSSASPDGRLIFRFNVHRGGEAKAWLRKRDSKLCPNERRRRSTSAAE